MERFSRYRRTLGAAATQLLGAIFGATFNANETTSGASYRLRNRGRGWAYDLINRLYFWQENHCFEAQWREAQDCVGLLEVMEDETLQRADIRERLTALAERIQ